MFVGTGGEGYMSEEKPVHEMRSLDRKPDGSRARTLVMGLIFGVLGVGLGIIISHFFLCNAASPI